MTTISAIDLRPLVAAREALRNFQREGFEVIDVNSLVRLRGRLANAPIGWALPLVLRQAARHTQAIGRRRGYDVTLTVVNELWEVTTLPEIDPDQLFEPDELDAARRLWERQASAADSVSLEWSIQIDLDLSKLLAAGTAARVNWRSDYIDEQFETAHRGDLRRLLPSSGRRVFVGLEGSAAPITFGSVTLATLDQTPQYELEVIPAADGLPGEGELHDLPGPADTILLTGDENEWPIASKAMSTGACTAIWSRVATGLDGDKLEFFGYKRVSFELPSDWNSAEIQSSKRLREWAFGDISPDRLLALRQIISLYTDPPFGFVDEILSSSETIYLGLRSSAVAEAVRDTRDVEMQVQLAVTQSSESSVALAKSTAERVLAGLLAVGAASIANVTQVLDASVTTVLLGFIGGYFVVMLTLFLLVDFTAVGLPIKQLGATSGLHAGFVRSETLKQLATSPLVSGAKALVLRVRIAVISLYGLIVIALAIAVSVRVFS